MGINVLSLFDGMSGGQIALERVGIKVDNYYSSEIDKYAIAVTQHNYPKTIQLGDITEWKSWNIDWSSVDLLIGGSPCQGFSNAGKGLNFEDPRSKLFFVYVDILNHVRKYNPDVKFLLENVRMKQEWLDIISEHLGVQPERINSNLVSAQNRDRYYWANWEFGQPEDKGVLLEDIINKGLVDKDKSYCVDANYFKGGNPKSYFSKGRRQLVFSYGSKVGFTKKIDKAHTLNASDYKSGSRLNRKQLQNAVVSNVGVSDFTYRKLTANECEKLQTLPKDYTLVPYGNRMMSDTQRYKMIGNGWTMDVIVHILENSPFKM